MEDRERPGKTLLLLQAGTARNHWKQPTSPPSRGPSAAEKGHKKIRVRKETWKINCGGDTLNSSRDEEWKGGKQCQENT